VPPAGHCGGSHGAARGQAAADSDEAGSSLPVSVHETPAREESESPGPSRSLAPRRAEARGWGFSHPSVHISVTKTDVILSGLASLSAVLCTGRESRARHGLLVRRHGAAHCSREFASSSLSILVHPSCGEMIGLGPTAGAPTACLCFRCGTLLLACDSGSPATHLAASSSETESEPLSHANLKLRP
jgi:hypothetical protein